MADSKEGYWSKHHTGIIQCVLGLYCAVFTTWVYFHPRGGPDSGQPTTSQAGAPMTSSYSMPLGLFLGIIALVLSVVIPAIIKFLGNRKKRHAEAVPSRLVIQSADYRAIAQGGGICDVTECLQKMVKGDSLILQIENHSFIVDGNNYVPVDPYYGEVKRLRVVYYFDGGSPRVAERPEHTQIVLPEDMFLIEHIATVQHQIGGLPETYKKFKEFPQLQIDALFLAKQIVTFIVAMGKCPEPSKESYGYNVQQRRFTDQDQLNAYFVEKRRLQAPWFVKFTSTWKADFLPWIETVLLEFGKFGIDTNGVIQAARDASNNRQAFGVGRDIATLAYGLDTMKAVPFLEEEKK
jgi:hypothetical protein